MYLENINIFKLLNKQFCPYYILIITSFLLANEVNSQNRIFWMSKPISKVMDANPFMNYSIFCIPLSVLELLNFICKKCNKNGVKFFYNIDPLILPGCRPEVCWAKAKRKRPRPGNLLFLRFFPKLRNTNRNWGRFLRWPPRPKESNRHAKSSRKKTLRLK